MKKLLFLSFIFLLVPFSRVKSMWGNRPFYGSAAFSSWNVTQSDQSSNQVSFVGQNQKVQNTDNVSCGVLDNIASRVSKRKRPAKKYSDYLDGKNEDYNDDDEDYNDEESDNSSFLSPAATILALQKKKMERKNRSKYVTLGHYSYCGKGFKCEYCGKIDGNSKNIKHHLEDVHNVDIEKHKNEQNLKVLKKKVQRKNRSKYVTLGHYSRYGKGFKCEYCGQIHENNKNIRRHLEDDHNVDIEKHKSEQNFEDLENLKDRNRLPLKKSYKTLDISKKRIPKRKGPVKNSKRFIEDEDIVEISEVIEIPETSTNSPIELHKKLTHILQPQKPKKRRSKKNSKNISECLERRGYVELLDGNKFKCNRCEKTLRNATKSTLPHVERCYGDTVKKTGSGEKAVFDIIKFSCKPPIKVKTRPDFFVEKGHYTKTTNKGTLKCAYCSKEFFQSDCKNHLVYTHKADLEKNIKDQNYSILRKVDLEILRKYKRNVNENYYLPIPNQFPAAQGNISSQNNQNNKLYQLLTPSTPVTPILTRPTFQNIPNQGQEESSRFLNNNFSSLTPLTPIPAIFAIQNQKQKKILGKRKTLRPFDGAQAQDGRGQEYARFEDNELQQKKKKRKIDPEDTRVNGIPDFSTKSPLDSFFDYENMFSQDDDDNIFSQDNVNSPLHGFNFGQDFEGQDIMNNKIFLGNYSRGNNYDDSPLISNFNFEQNSFDDC
ncbi:hypothetical protein ACFLYA_02835 [Candidatus Dependentiae bacterium]